MMEKMDREYRVGEEFLLACDVVLDEIVIPKDTLFSILEIREEESPYKYHIHFSGYGSEENFHRFSGDEIDEMRQSAMAEY
jgi:hypothetical protein